jgi:hypothetical protein
MKRRSHHHLQLLAGSAVTLGALLLASSAQAQNLWNPLDTKANPNAIVGFDMSITMRINESCSGCHEGAGISAGERWYVAKESLKQVAPLFKDLFVWGGFTYKGCGSARVVDRSAPIASDKEQSYDNVFAPGTGLADRLSSHICIGRPTKEYLYPGGSAVVNCLTPTALCAGDAAALQNIYTNPPTGLSLPGQPSATSTTCTMTMVPAPPMPSINPGALLGANLATGGYQWPRWSSSPGGISAHMIDEEFCGPMETQLTAVRNALAQCLVDPDAYWDLSFLSGGRGSWCNGGQLLNSICQPGSPFFGTCACDATSPACFSSGTIMSECGLPLTLPPATWQARQVVGVCESIDETSGRTGAALRAQPDNRLNAGGCRENVAMFFTDGTYGNHTAVQAHAMKALTGGTVSGITVPAVGTYMSADEVPQPNMYVFHISSEAAGAANTMQSFLSNGAIPNRFRANSQTEMRIAFAEVTNRVMHGTYTGATPGLDRYESWVAFHNFSVFGRKKAADHASVPDDKYLPHPSRISLHRMDANGVLESAPFCETDWASIAKTGLMHQPSSAVAAGFGLNVATHRDKLGLPWGLDPTGRAFLNYAGDVRYRAHEVAGGALDRDGDDVYDTHPPLTLGFMNGGTSTRPVIVDAPRELPSGGAASTAFNTYLANNRTRERIVYTWSNGYLHAFYGGRQSAGAPRFGVNLQYQYVPDADSCREYWRYRPTWVPSTPDYTYSNLVKVPLTTGQIAVREVQLAASATPSASDYATVLVGAQGKGYRGLIAMNVTNPQAPTVLRDWTLPAGYFASSEPTIYQLPTTGTQPKVAVVMTGGEDGTAGLVMAGINGGPGFGLATRALPANAGEDYPTSPVCLDATGKGGISHCYAVSRWGRLVRVSVQSTAGFPTFGPAVDLSSGAGSLDLTSTATSRRYWAAPVAYFDANNNVVIAYGSGNIKNLTTPNSSQNYFYKVVDRTFRKASGVNDATTSNSCSPTSGSISGVIALDLDEHVVSPAVVAKGVVAFTTYRVGASACNAGNAYLRAFNYQTCVDAFAGTGAPAAKDIGTGIPTSPTILRGSQAVFTQTSARTGAAARTTASIVQTEGGQRLRLRRLYWRPTIRTL